MIHKSQVRQMADVPNDIKYIYRASAAIFAFTTWNTLRSLYIWLPYGSWLIFLRAISSRPNISLTLSVLHIQIEIFTILIFIFYDRIAHTQSFFRLFDQNEFKKKYSIWWEKKAHEILILVQTFKVFISPFNKFIISQLVQVVQCKFLSSLPFLCTLM